MSHSAASYNSRLNEADLHLRAAARELEQAASSLAAAVDIDPTPSPTAQSLIWTLQRQRGQNMQYFGAAFQDRFLNEAVFHDRTAGSFVDIGAYDGVTGSNTLFFEKFLGWTGLCIEPEPHRFAELRAMRACQCVQACVSGQEGQAEFLRVRQGFTQMSGLAQTIGGETAHFLIENSTTETIHLPTTRLDSLLDAHGISEIDYLSVDIEGAELAVLQTLDFTRFRVTAISVERNHNEFALRHLLRHAGFCRVRQLAGDDIFIRADHVTPALAAELLAEAIAHYDRGDARQAEAAYRDLHLVDADNPGTHYNLALTLLCQGRREEARTTLSHALTLKAEFQPAVDLLESMQERREELLF